MGKEKITKNKSSFLKSLSEEKEQSVDLTKFDEQISEEKNNDIKKLIDEVKKSNKLTTETAKQCLDFIQRSEKDIDYLNEHSDFFGRIWGTLTGKTMRLSTKSKQDLANAQRCCIQIINEMNKQMLLSQDQILMLENLVNYMIVENDKFRKGLQIKLKNIFDVVKKRFEMIENTIYELSLREHNTRELVIKLEEKLGKEIEQIWYRTDYLEEYILKVERQVETLEWIQLISSYNNDYDQLKENKVILFLSAIFDFYRHKKGNFTYKDLLLFSSALRQLGFEVEESITVDHFFEEYIDALYPDELYETVDNFLGIKTRDSKQIKKLSKEGYYSFGTDQTKFVTAINVTNYLMDHNSSLHENSSEIVKSDLKAFLEKSGLYFDKPINFNWFLIACELLSYKRMSLFSIEKDTIVDNKEFILAIDKGRNGIYLIKQDIINLYLDKALSILVDRLIESPYARNYIALKKFLSEDPYTNIEYEEYENDKNFLQFEITLDSGLDLGIYSRIDPNKTQLEIICALSIADGTHLDLFEKIDKKCQNIKIKNFLKNFNSYGYRYVINGSEDFLGELPEKLANNYLELLEILSQV